MTNVVKMTFIYPHYKVYFCFSLSFLVIPVLKKKTKKMKELIAFSKSKPVHYWVNRLDIGLVNQFL